MSLFQRGHKLWYRQMVTQLHINKEMYIFHNCLHYFVYPQYLSGKPSKVNIISHNNEDKHMWNWFPILSMTEQNYNHLSRWAKNGRRFLIVLICIATITIQGMDASVPVHYSVPVNAAV